MSHTAKLKAIEIANFRSFKDKQTLEFPDSGVYLVEGLNHDTGGSSGAGKSSFDLAIQYGLGCAPFPATELLCWYSNDPIDVKLKLDTSKGEAIISRGSKLSMKLAGNQVRGGAEAVESTIQDVLGGLSSDVVKILTYRGQGEPGKFLSMGDTAKKEFLTSLLQLDKFEAQVEYTKNRIATYTTSLTLAESSLENVKRRKEAAKPTVKLAEVEEVLNAAKAELDNFTYGLLTKQRQKEELKTKRDAEEQIIYLSFSPMIGEKETLKKQIKYQPPEDDTTEQDKIKASIQEATKRLSKVQDNDTKRNRERLEKLKALKAQIAEGHKDRATAANLDGEKERLEGELAQLQALLCPTCERQWNDDRSKSKINAITMQLAQIDNTIESIATSTNNLENLETQVAELYEFTPDPKVDQFKKIIEKLNSQLATEVQRGKSAEAVAKAEWQAKIAEVDKDLSNLQAQRLEAINKMSKEFDAEIATIDSEIFECQQSILQLNAQVAKGNEAKNMATWQQDQYSKLWKEEAELTDNVIAAEKSLNAEKDFMQLIGKEGFLGSIFDEVLAEIASEANDILGAVANTRQCTIAFRSESVTQKNTIKKSIVPVVTIRGIEAKLASGLSGGMMTAVELAVDLALGAVISRRAGVNLGWLILDESFDGLDPVCKESCMEILQQYGRDKLVLVVDHASEFKGLFQGTITIECTDGISSIKKS